MAAKSSTCVSAFFADEQAPAKMEAVKTINPQVTSLTERHVMTPPYSLGVLPDGSRRMLR